MKKQYIAIDLKAFYASVECIERNLDPLTTNLVVADNSRTNKTICLAVSPSLKMYGIASRPRLFEVEQKVKEINRERLKISRKFKGSSFYDVDLRLNPSLKLDYIVAMPRMALYIEYSSRIYDIYLKYVSKEDIHVYSIDEVFMDVTNYLKTYNTTAEDLAMKIIVDVLTNTGVTATAGVGTNLYLSKVAMDIVAKKLPPNENGVRLASLDEISYRYNLWNHKPLTDFWRIGRGYSRKLEAHGMYTMGDIARCSLENEDLLYDLFGINAELLIDHAWGYEPCTMKDIKNYKPSAKSLGSGQVLHKPYPYKKAKLIIKEMVDLLTLDMVDKGLVSNQFVLTIGYDIKNVTDDYKGEIKVDFYGRKIPKHSSGTANLDMYTSSTKLITKAIVDLFDNIVNKNLYVRKVSLAATKVISEQELKDKNVFNQMNLFNQDFKQDEKLEKERDLQNTILNIKKKYGKNSILKGMNLEEDATTLDRNKQIGGHKA
ncbi:MAG: DNA methylase [Erysipelotrichaceae bacterium]|nr:DNA methylase [Bacillota bacterium]NLP22363.1 DNA methylase [Erysipelotrichaceae bacterium]HCY06568.1 DNA methylase [Erysipelotrichaceae bacterium]